MTSRHMDAGELEPQRSPKLGQQDDQSDPRAEIKELVRQIEISVARLEGRLRSLEAHVTISLDERIALLERAVTSNSLQLTEGLGLTARAVEAAAAAGAAQTRLASSEWEHLRAMQVQLQQVHVLHKEQGSSTATHPEGAESLEGNGDGCPAGDWQREAGFSNAAADVRASAPTKVAVVPLAGGCPSDAERGSKEATDEEGLAAVSAADLCTPVPMEARPRGEDKMSDWSPKLDCSNVHAWAIACATQQDRSLGATVLVLMFTLAFIAFQIALLGGTMMESSFPRCTNHEQCRAGEWCSPSLMGVPTTDPGVCFDCWSSYHMYDGFFLNSTYDTFPDSYETMAIAAGGDWLHAGVTHCNRTDHSPRHCDFLQTNRRAVSGVNVFVLLAVALFLMVPMIDDMVEATFVDLVMHRRTPAIVDWKRRWAIVAVWWLNVRLRLFVLPVFTIGATAGLILSGPMHSYDLLLNGVAITFVMTLDDCLGALCLQYKEEEGESVDASLIQPYHQWLFHRFYTALLGLGLVVTVLEAESLMPWFGNEVKYGRACSDIREVATGLALWITMGMSVIRALYHHGDAVLKRKWGFSFWALVFDCVVTPLLVWRIVYASAGQYVLLYGQAGIALPYSVLSGI